MSNKNQLKRQRRLERQRTPGSPIVRNGVVLQKGVIDMSTSRRRGSHGVSPRYDGYTEEEMLRAIGIATAVRNANARLEPKQYALPLAQRSKGTGYTDGPVVTVKPSTPLTSVRPSVPRLPAFRPSVPHTVDEKTIIAEAHLLRAIDEALAANRTQITAAQLAHLLMTGPNPVSYRDQKAFAKSR